MGTLAAAGLLDDSRLARARATALADRGWGDLAIAARLEGEGINEAEVRLALAELPSEAARAVDLVAELVDPRRACSLLARRGFSPEAVEAALGPLDGG